MRALLALLLFLPFAALAQPYPQPLSDTVSDFANLLPPADEARIRKTLQAARDETDIHIIVVTMDRIKNYGSGTQPFASYAKNLFNDWGIGDPERNDGILILVAKDDREMRIALGSGYDAPYDGLAQRSIDSVMRPLFRNNRYAEGIESGAVDVIARIARPFAAHAPVKAPATPVDPTIWIVTAAMTALGLFSARRGISDQFIRFRRCPGCGARMQSRTHEEVYKPTETTQGEGVSTTRCSNCQMETRVPYVISSIRSSSSSGGGGGGFGGGRSSGGGASGKW